MRVRTILAALAAVLALGHAAAHRPAAVVSHAVRTHLGPRARGAVHVHTRASQDAGGDVDDVARAARAAGLAFVVVTEHNTEASLGIDGYRHGVLVVGGYEKSTDAGHALVLGLRGLPFRLDGDPATVVRDVADLGGFVVAAHPVSSHPESQWTTGFDGVAGVECLSLAEPGAWPRGLGLALPLLRYTVDPQGALLSALRVSRAPLDVWDRALAQRPLSGIVGSDAHGGVRIKRLWLPFPSHLQVFRLASQHLLLESALDGDAEHDRALVLAALRGGRGYAALDALADASGFDFEARSGGRTVHMGETLAWDGRAEILAEADAPAGTTLVLLRNGREVARGPALRTAVDAPGTYRVEAYLDEAVVPGRKRLPWIVSNPIDVFSAETLAARGARATAVPAPEPEPPGPTLVLEAFGGPVVPPAWRVDRSDDAAGRLSIDDGALRFDFGLGAGPKTHAAAIDWQPRDLSDHDTLVFEVRADRRMRLDVQVRVERPDGAGTRIFRRSVRAERSWRRVAVALAGLKTYDHEGGAPDLAACRGISFHVDEAILSPGSRGTLWIDDVGLGP